MMNNQNQTLPDLPSEVVAAEAELAGYFKLNGADTWVFRDCCSRNHESRCALLRAALVRLVGVDGKVELDQLESAVKINDASPEDKETARICIDALRQTL